MTEVIVQLLEDIDATAFYGVNNINIRILKDLFPNVKFVARGRMIKLIGKDTEVENLVNIINILMRKVANTNKLTEDEIVDIIKAIAPREFMIVCSDEDKYSKDASSIYEQAKGNYRLMDAESMLQIKQFHGGHQLTQERYDFIMEWMLKHA